MAIENFDVSDYVDFDDSSWSYDDTDWGFDDSWDYSLDSYGDSDSYWTQNLMFDTAINETDYGSNRFDSYLFDEEFDQEPYVFNAEEENKGLLGGLLKDKDFWSGVANLGKTGFQAWQAQKSQERQDELSDKEFERAKELMRLKAELANSGGGGGGSSTVAIARGTGASKVGDFTKRP